jgi:transposase-like protein
VTIAEPKRSAAMLKAIHASEDKKAAIEKAESVYAKLVAMKLTGAAKKIQESIVETLTYYDFPMEHRIRIRTNNALERIMKEIRRRTKVVGAFPDGHSALMLCAARLRHIAGTQWGAKRYLNIDLLKEQEMELELKSQLAEAV